MDSGVFGELILEDLHLTGISKSPAGAMPKVEMEGPTLSLAVIARVGDHTVKVVDLPHIGRLMGCASIGFLGIVSSRRPKDMIGFEGDFVAVDLIKEDHAAVRVLGVTDASWVDGMMIVPVGVGGEGSECLPAVAIAGLFVPENQDAREQILGNSNTVKDNLIGDNRVGGSNDTVVTEVGVEGAVVQGDDGSGLCVVFIGNQPLERAILGGRGRAACTNVDGTDCDCGDGDWSIGRGDAAWTMVIRVVAIRVDRTAETFMVK